MARPTTKEDLLYQTQKEFETLMALIDGLDPGLITAEFLFEDRDKNIRDVLAHLHEWHIMLNGWHRIGVIEKGTPVIPKEGYTWKTIPLMNQKIWEAYQDQSYEEVRAKLEKSHEMIMNLIQDHTNESLFTSKVYPWTKTTTLGAYFIGSGSSHYGWAQKKIKKHRSTYKKLGSISVTSDDSSGNL